MMIESGAVSKSFPVFCPAPDAEEFFFWEEGWPPMSNQLWLLIIYLFFVRLCGGEDEHFCL